MIRVAIVDDEKVIHAQLRKYINEYELVCAETFNITSFYDGSEIIKDYRPIFDIIFLDVQMKEVDGFQTAEKIREIDTKVIIIFVTNMADFAIKGYKVDALSYVIKPILYFDFSQQLSKAVERVIYSRKAYILVNMNSEFLRLDISQISYFESIGHKLLIHMEKDELVVYSSIKKIEQQVANYHFARCNSGYLVNLSHVKDIEGNDLVVGEDRLLISRSKKKTFMNKLADYIGGNYK